MKNLACAIRKFYASIRRARGAIKDRYMEITSSALRVGSIETGIIAVCLARNEPDSQPGSFPSPRLWRRKLYGLIPAGNPELFGGLFWLTS